MATPAGPFTNYQGGNVTVSQSYAPAGSGGALVAPSYVSTYSPDPTVGGSTTNGSGKVTNQRIPPNNNTSTTSTNNNGLIFFALVALVAIFWVK